MRGRKAQRLLDSWMSEFIEDTQPGGGGEILTQVAVEKILTQAVVGKIHHQVVVEKILTQVVVVVKIHYQAAAAAVTPELEAVETMSLM